MLSLAPGAQPAEQRFDVPPTGDSILASSPLSRREVLAEFVRAAAARFSPSQYRFVLFVRSHGDSHFVATPRLAVDAAALGRQRLLDIARGRAEVPDRPGITKQAFFDTLGASAPAGCAFPIVYLHSCDSAAGIDAALVPANVGAVFGTAAWGTRQEPLRLAELLAQPGAGRLPARQLFERLQARRALVGRDPRANGLVDQLARRGWYFTPLGLVVAYWLYGRVRAQRRRAALPPTARSNAA